MINSDNKREYENYSPYSVICHHMVCIVTYVDCAATT